MTYTRKSGRQTEMWWSLTGLATFWFRVRSNKWSNYRPHLEQSSVSRRCVSDTIAPLQPASFRSDGPFNILVQLPLMVTRYRHTVDRDADRWAVLIFVG